MLQDIINNIPRAVTREHVDELERLKNSEVYKEASKFAFEFLKDSGSFDRIFCKKHNLDYANNLSEDNIAKIMIAYLIIKEEKTYEIYKKVYESHS